MDHETLGAALALAKKTLVDPELIEEKVEGWLDDHPEATTTVQDGAISYSKLDASLKGKADEVSRVSNALQVKADKTDTVLETTLSRGRKANTTIGSNSYAFGYNVEASGTNSHAESFNTIASGNGSHAEGGYNQATGAYSHAEGGQSQRAGCTIASGISSHAEGSMTQAVGQSSHAEGTGTRADGNSSHAGGRHNVRDSYSAWPEWVANTEYSIGDKVKVTTTENETTVVQGYICKTANSDAEFTVANWDKDTKMNFAEIIGNGASNSARSNARALDWDGNEYLMGDVYVGANADSTGGVKLARIPDPPSTDGTYILKSTVASGVITYSWVTE